MAFLLAKTVHPCHTLVLWIRKVVIIWSIRIHVCVNHISLNNVHVVETVTFCLCTVETLLINHFDWSLFKSNVITISTMCLVFCYRYTVLYNFAFRRDSYSSIPSLLWNENPDSGYLFWTRYDAHAQIEGRWILSHRKRPSSSCSIS